MPILSRALLLSVQAAALVATVGQAPLAAFAAPVPAPLPLPPHLPDYASQPPGRNNTTFTPHAQNIAVGEPGQSVAVVKHTTPNTSPMVRRQDLASFVALLHDWQSSGTAFGSEHDDLLEKLGITQVIECVQNYNALLLSDAGADKGLANYDPNNPLVKFLRGIVDSIKYSLNSADELSNGLDKGLPKLGLADVVYIIKCIVIKVLDTTENITDGIITKGLVEELRVLLKQTQNMQCTLGLFALGFCM